MGDKVGCSVVGEIDVAMGALLDGAELGAALEGAPLDGVELGVALEGALVGAQDGDTDGDEEGYEEGEGEGAALVGGDVGE